MTPLERKTVFLRTHAIREEYLNQAVQGFFHDQADRMARAVETSKHPGTWLVPEIFNVQREHEKLADVVNRPLFATMVRAAAETLNFAKHEGDAKSIGEFFRDGWELSFDLPALVLRGIRQAVTELIQQPYWIDLQKQTTNILSDIIQIGVEDGANASRIARKIREEMGGSIARHRALKISRTETTGALNAGSTAAAEDLQRDGFQTVQEWSTTRDNDARDSHLELDRVRVRVGENFMLGGHPCPYPGHYSLPARERVNCRCGCITRILD